MAELTEGSHLWLLGRSGRGSWDPVSAGNGLVSLARSDVSVLEEADYVIQAAGQHKGLQVGKYSVLSLKCFDTTFSSC